ncbi:MFS transporter [Ralstonia insidiosa]|uniref:MFS transporter n=1 Tax=Ralstonia insidiosa TaxID=190721 RepID=A0A848P265_9RALS|nr:MFS transporter [Ralstonia insidiosa]NMV41402.1 MFS transporter [Ralstonia insidiosa]
MKKWIVLFSIGIYLLLINLDLTIVNLALAEFSKDFNANIEQIQLVIVSYLAAAAAFFCLSGVLADRYGKKRVFMAGGLLFVLSSLYIGAFAHSIEAIIAARFVQGIGFSATLGLALILIGKAFPPEQKGLATGVAVTITGIGLAAGPPLGGFILQAFGWEMIFLINVPLGLLSLLLTAVFVDKDDPNELSARKLDVVGVPQYLLGLGCLIVLSNALATLSWAQIGALTGVGAISTVLFVRRSLRVEAPLINLSLLKNGTYLTVVGIRIIFNFVMASFLFVLPLFMQNILNYSKVRAGLWVLCMTACIFVVGPITGKVIDRHGYKLPVLTGMTLLLVSCAAFLTLRVELSIVLFVIGLVSFGLSNGALTTATINGATSQVSPKHTGTAIGLFFTLSMVGAMFGVAVSGLVLSKVGEFELARHIASAAATFTPEQLHTLLGLVNASQNLVNVTSTFADHPIDAVRDLVNTSYVPAMRALMAFNALLAAIGIGLSVALFKRKETRPAESTDPTQSRNEHLEGAV